MPETNSSGGVRFRRKPLAPARSAHREADACRNVFGRAGHRERCLEWWFAEAVDQLDEIGETRRRRRSIVAPQHAGQPVEFIEG